MLVAFGGYLLGSIPTGYLAARARGIDIRTVGSGNIGATNVFRVLGRKAGTGVLLADALKGWLAVSVLAELVFTQFGNTGGDTSGTTAALHSLQLLAGIAAILGHNYTCWLGFKGGKGIATTGGVLIAWLPQAFLVVLVTWLVVFAVSRYVSLASIAAAVVLPVAAWYFNGRPEMVLITGALSALAMFKHRANIQRLLNGTENRFGKKKGTSE